MSTAHTDVTTYAVSNSMHSREESYLGTDDLFKVGIVLFAFEQCLFKHDLLP